MRYLDNPEIRGDVKVTGMFRGRVRTEGGFYSESFGEVSYDDHTHVADDIIDGTFDDARISESSVTKHERALSIQTDQIPDFYLNLLRDVTVPSPPTQEQQSWSEWPPQNGTNQKLLSPFGYSEDDDEWREKESEEGLFIPLDGSVTGSNDIAFGGGAIPGVWFDAGFASGDKMAVWATSGGYFLGWWDASAGVFKRVLGMSTSNVHTFYIPGTTTAALQASSSGLLVQSALTVIGAVTVFGSFGVTNATLGETTSITGRIQKRRVARGTSGALIVNANIHALTAAGLTVTLPEATADNVGLEILVKDESGGATASPHTIQPNGADTIDGAGSSISIDSDYGFRRLYVGTAGAWFIV